MSWRVNCPVCGNVLYIEARLSVTIECSYCGSILSVARHRVQMLRRGYRAPPPRGVRPAVAGVGGALLGAAVAGPVGALFGFVLGIIIGGAADEESNGSTQ